MLIFRLIHAGRWPTLFGYAILSGILAAGILSRLALSVPSTR
jgi:hypothetical protein